MNDFTSTTFDVHTTILWVCAAIAIVVFAVMLYSIATFRKSSQGGAAAMHRGALAESLWAIIPIVIVVSMSVPAVRTLVLAAETPAVAHNAPEDTQTAFQLVRQKSRLLPDVSKGPRPLSTRRPVRGQL